MNEDMIKNCVTAYSPLLKKLNLSAKIEIYQAIYYPSPEEATEEMLSLGVAITADPMFQWWMNERLKGTKPPASDR